jgi:predicted AlkP superfamily phosphohydrolase/phosphomutase
LVLALDAASPTLLERWASSGELPNLRRLMAGGLTVRTRSVDGFFVGATWPSFYTGCGPATHGLYWLDRLLPGSYRMQRAVPNDFGRRPALWEVLSRAGREVLVLDVPLTRLSPGLRGSQVVEWGVHDEAFGFHTRPRGLARQLRRTVGGHPVPSSCDARRTPAEYRDFAASLARGAAARAEWTTRLLAERPWDFAIQVFSETHCAGHQLWHFHDPDHPAHLEGDPDLVLDVYRAVDQAVGEIVAGVGEETWVAVMSLHAMGPTCGASLLLPDILGRLGVYHPDRAPDPATPGRPSSPPGAPPSRERPSVSRVLRSLYHRLPGSVRRPVYDLRQAINQRVLGRGSPLGFDPSRTRAFPIGLGQGAPFSGIRLNLRGREPEGTLAPGSASEDFCAELAEALLALERPGSDLPVVRAVHRTRDLHRGPRLDELPDLLVEWHTEPPVGTAVAGDGGGSIVRVRSEAIGELARENRYCRTGEHRPEGLLVLSGAGLTPGVLDREVSNLDLAPTFAALLGCVMPEAEGRPLPELER